MTNEKQPKIETSRELEWRLKQMDIAQGKIQIFTDAVKKFLEEGTPIDVTRLEKAMEKVEYLRYADEEGYLDINMLIYQKKQELGIGNDAFYSDMQSRAKNLGDAILYASSAHAFFMIGHYGDKSDTVPVVLKRRMLETTLKEIEELAELYKKEIRLNNQKDNYPNLDEPIKTIIEKYKTQYAQIQKEADPYISADMQVTLTHKDEYARLQEEFLRAGGKEENPMIGEQAHNFIRYLLTRLHQDEFIKYLKEFQDDPNKQVDRQKRNDLLEEVHNREILWKQENLNETRREPNE